jgi:hypothetical protein
MCYALVIDIVCMQDPGCPYPTTMERVLEIINRVRPQGEVKDLTVPTQFVKIFLTVTQIMIAGNKYNTLFVLKVTVTVTFIFDFSIV